MIQIEDLRLVGAVRDSSWIARTLAPNARWLCASPAYLRAHGTPADPRELLEHACICIRENDEDVTLWRFRRPGPGAARRLSARVTLRVVPPFTTNDGSVARQWAEQGLGLVLRSEWDSGGGGARLAGPRACRLGIRQRPGDFTGADAAWAYGTGAGAAAVLRGGIGEIAIRKLRVCRGELSPAHMQTSIAPGWRSSRRMIPG